MNASALGASSSYTARPAGVSDRKDFPQIGAIWPPGDELALLELRHRARDFGLVHMGLRADRLAGHHALLAERDEHAPFGYPNTITAIDPRERLRHQAGQDVEPVRQKIFELEQRRLSAHLVGRGGGLHRAVTDWTRVHHRPRPGVERSVATAEPEIGRRSNAVQRRWPRAPGRREREFLAASITRCGSGLVPRTRSLRIPCGKCDRELRVQKGHRMNCSGPDFEFDPNVPRVLTNFRIDTSACSKWEPVFRENMRRIEDLERISINPIGMRASAGRRGQDGVSAGTRWRRMRRGRQIRWWSVPPR